MQKELLLSLALTIVICSAKAQRSDPAKPDTDNIVFNSYTIHLQHLPDNSYGYSIMYQSRAIIVQNKNPFISKQTGLKTKEDALKLAKWQIIHLTSSNKQQLQSNPPVDPDVARQLNITVN